MIVVLIALGVGCALGCTYVIHRDLMRVVKVTKNLHGEMRELRLTSRARISQTKVRSGAVTDEETLVRLGRASKAKRVVVGGDPDSNLHTNLSTRLPGEFGVSDG